MRLREVARRLHVGAQLTRFATPRVPAWLAAIGAPRRAGVRVSYGRELPELSDVSVGGIVKFEHLARTLPNSQCDFSVLYLGSSSVPLDAAVLVRIARLRGAAFVWNQNGVAYRAWAGDAAERMNRPARRLLHAADHVFFQSAFCKVAADRMLGERVGPWEVLHNPVDTTRFTPAPRPDRPLTLLLGGSQYQRYRLDVALETLALLPEARLIVSGDLSFGPDARSVLDTHVTRLGIGDRLELTGPFSQLDAPALYRRADILLHTKVMDPCPSAVLEAMSSGVPVVYAASGGTPELVGADAGVAVNSPVDWERDHPPDPQALAAAVRQLSDQLDRYAAAARNRAVEQFDLQPWVERHREIFAELVG